MPLMEKFVELCAQESLGQEERARLVEGLLDRGELDLGKRDNSGWYPIHYAAQYGRVEIVTLFLRHCDPHAETRGTRSTALHVACANDRLDVVEALLRFCQDGAPPKRDRDGNTPLHLACKVGSLQITNRLLGKYPTRAAYELNRSKVTPLGFAMRANNVPVARLLLQRLFGNPARKFPDFRQHFPGFKHKQSLDHPVTIFVMGNRQTGKSTLIKSLQVEGYLNRAIGVIKSTLGVEHHSGGVVPSDVSSYGYGRAKFYELASGYQTTHENIFLSIAEPAHSIFLIVLSFKDERKEMEAHLLYWLSFIYHQCRSMGIMKLNVAVVGSFLFYNKLGGMRLDNRHRLHLVYHHVLSSETHSELCSHFHFLGKYSMDCRRSESPGLTQLRNILRHRTREVRPSGGEQNVPSFCYVLFSALHELLPVASGIPVLKLSEIVHHISQSASSSQMCSLLSLLPPSGEDLKPYLEILEERRAIVVINHIDPRDPWIIFDEYKLLSHIDGMLIQKALQMSQASHLINPAIMPLEKLLECLSPTPLEKEVLLNILHKYRITEVMPHNNITRYFLPSVLHTVQFSEAPLPLWNLNDPKNFGFAWCIVPQPDQIVPFFMPRFLYFMLYELLASTEEDDFDTVTMSHSGLYYKEGSQLDVCVTVDKSAVIINMRCIAGMEVTCLQYRSRFLSAIHQQRQLLQPHVKVNEFIIPMEEITLPVQKLKQIQKHGTQVNHLKNTLVGMGNATTARSLQKLLSFEPYVWVSKLSEANQKCLLNPSLTNVPANKEFIQDLAKCTEGKWSAIAESLELPQRDSDTHTSAEEADQEANTDESSGEEKQGPQRPPYGQLLEFFSTMSIFQSTSELISSLKVSLHIHRCVLHTINYSSFFSGYRAHFIACCRAIQFLHEHNE